MMARNFTEVYEAYNTIAAHAKTECGVDFDAY